MVQIHGYSLGSPTANITAAGELVTTGSFYLTNGSINVDVNISDYISVTPMSNGVNFKIW